MVAPHRDPPASGSTISPCAVSVPWASRVARGGHRRLQVGHHTQAGQDVIGSHGGVTCRTTRSSIAHGAPVDPGRCVIRALGQREADHRRPGVERAAALLGQPLDQHLVGGEERGDGASAAVAGSTSGQLDPPAPTRRSGRPGHPAPATHGLEHVQARARAPRRARDAASPGRPRSAGRSPGTRPRWRPRSGAALRVRDLGVRGEALRVRDRHAGPAERPLERPGEVAVRGEAQRAALGVPDPDPLHDRGLAAGWLVLADGCLLSECECARGR